MFNSNKNIFIFWRWKPPIHIASVVLKNEIIIFPVIQKFSDINDQPNLHHFCLVLVDTKNKNLLFLNPYRNSIEETTLYLDKFLIYLRRYNETKPALHRIDTVGWSPKLISYDLQNDSFNCGVYIIYYFENIVNGRKLLNNVSMNDYRKYLQQKLIENSDDITNDCIYCGHSVSNHLLATLQCHTCKRRNHLRCISNEKLVSESSVLCDLCYKY